jgi:hypothetical protein
LLLVVLFSFPFSDPKNETKRRFARDMVETLSPYLLAERAPVVVGKPNRGPAASCDDPKFASVLTGKRRSKPARIIDVSVFGFALDILEIRFFELYDAVDLFVVLESTMTHRGVRKPLFLEQARTRFLRFAPKLLRLIDDGGRFFCFFFVFLHLFFADETFFRFGADENEVSGVKKAYVDNWKLETRAKALVFEKLSQAIGELTEE